MATRSRYIKQIRAMNRRDRWRSEFAQQVVARIRIELGISHD